MDTQRISIHSLGVSVSVAGADIDGGEHDGDAEQHNNNGREVDQQRLRPKLITHNPSRRRLQEGELLQEPKHGSPNSQRKQHEPRRSMPRHGRPPGLRPGQPREEEGEKPGEPLDEIEREHGDPEPGVERVEVRDGGLGVVLEDGVQARPAHGQAQQVERQVDLLAGLVGRGGREEGGRVAVEEDGLGRHGDRAQEHERRVDVEDELLVLAGAEGEAAAEADAPEEDEGYGCQREDVHRQHQRRRPPLCHWLASWLPIDGDLASSICVVYCVSRLNDSLVTG